MKNTNQYINIIKIGSRIRILREKLGLSRERFAEITRLSTYYIGQIERGERTMSLETLVKISTTLNASIDCILKGHTHYMENILAIESIDSNYKDELDDEIKEILTLLSGLSKEELSLIKDMIKLIIPNIKK